MEIIINTVVVTPTCTFCDKEGTLAMTTDQHARYKKGGLIHEALPDMPTAEREQLISGTHPECWTETFG